MIHETITRVKRVLTWIDNDYKSYPFRFRMEVLAWVIGFFCAITMAMTVPNPPLLQVYFLWVIGNCILCWASFTRKSFGLLVNYTLLGIIDTIGFIRLVLSYV